MRILYLINYDLNEENGVVNKIKQQSTVWTKQGHTVFFVSYKTLSLYNNNYEIIENLKTLNIQFGRIGTALKLFYNMYFVEKLLKKIEFDIIYMRYQLYTPFISNFLKKHKVIMEINSDDLEEYKLSSKITHNYNKYTRRFLLKYVDGFISVSYELRDKFLYWNKPIEVIANGIDTKSYKVVFPKNKVPILVFIGTPNQPWHGIDKIEKLAQKFLQYKFYIIGTKKENTQNITYFGYLSNKESSKIVQQCDIGIGTLSLYKKGLQEASPLKTRQYLACGLPIIYAYDDTDIKSVISFALKLDNSNNNLDYSKIEYFIDNMFQNSNEREKARMFAEKTLDYEIKERKRLDFFKKIINEK
jgi:hypothetical protein